MLISIKGYKRVNGILKGKRKQQMYRVPHEFIAEINDVEDMPEIIGFQIHRKDRYTRFDIVKPYYEHNGIPYVTSLDYEKRGDMVSSEYSDDLIKLSDLFHSAKRDNVNKFVLLMEHVNINHDFSELHYITNSDTSLPIIDEDDLKTIISDDEQLVSRMFNRAVSNYFIHDGTVFIPTYGPSFHVTYNTATSRDMPYLNYADMERLDFPDIDKITFTDENFAHALSVNMMGDFCPRKNERLIAAFDRTSDSRNETYIMDMEPFINVNRNRQGYLLYQAMFGCGLEKGINDAFQKPMRHPPIRTSDWFLEKAFAIYHFGDELKEKIQIAKANDYDPEMVMNAINIFYENHEVIDHEMNAIHLDRRKPVSVASDGEILQSVNNDEVTGNLIDKISNPNSSMYHGGSDAINIIFDAQFLSRDLKKFQRKILSDDSCPLKP